DIRGKKRTPRAVAGSPYPATTESSAAKVAHSLRECGQLAERVAYRFALAALDSISTGTRLLDNSLPLCGGGLRWGYSASPRSALPTLPETGLFHVNSALIGLTSESWNGRPRWS